MLLYIAGIALLIGVDMYVSFKRLTRYGPLVELNPLARLIAKEHGTHASVAFLMLWNLGLLSLVSPFPTLVHMLFGAKLGLAAMQVKSLETENFVETVLRAAKARKNNNET